MSDLTSLNPYADHLASLFKFCYGVVDELELNPSSQGGLASGPIINLDAYGDGNDLPVGNLLGISNYSMDINDHLVVVTVMFVVITQGDLNNMILDKATGKLLNYLLPTKKIPVVREADGEEIGTMAVGKEVRVLPMSGDQNRNFKMIAVELHSTATLEL